MSTTKRVLGGALASFVGLASALFMAAPAYADNGPHMSQVVTQVGTKAINTLGQERCASCHRAHTAKSSYLLAASSQEALCFTCHGAGGAGALTNVQQGFANGTGGALRGGGFDEALIGAHTATKELYDGGRATLSSRNQVIPTLVSGEATTSNHLNAAAGQNVVWGNGPISASVNPGVVASGSTALECGSCHDPHGNGNYRILKPVPNNAEKVVVVAATATTPAVLTAPVTIPDTTFKQYTTTNYWNAADVPAFNNDPNFKTLSYLGGTSTTNPTPIVKTITNAGVVAAGGVDKYLANVSAWCTTCHTRYLAPSGSWGNSSGDAVFTYRHTGDNISGEIANNRNCIQCHVAHGSNAAMSAQSAVEYPAGTTKSTDSRLLRVDERGICLMCHNV